MTETGAHNGRAANAGSTYFTITGPQGRLFSTRSLRLPAFDEENGSGPPRLSPDPPTVLDHVGEAPRPALRHGAAHRVVRLTGPGLRRRASGLGRRLRSCEARHREHRPDDQQGTTSEHPKPPCSAAPRPPQGAFRGRYAARGE